MPYYRSKKTPINRENLINKDPATVYDGFDSEPIGTGRFSKVKIVTDKRTGTKYAAKCIKFDDYDVKYAVRELDVMTRMPKHKALPQLHEAYLVRKYLILIMDLVEGKVITDFIYLTEYDIADVIRQLCEALVELHAVGIIHADIRPTNIRIVDGQVKLLDFNSVLKRGDVADMIGDSEFCAPEMLDFTDISEYTDMWSVAVLAYTLASGRSPFYYEDEDKAIFSVQKVNYSFNEEMNQVTAELRDFIEKCLLASQVRLSSSQALKSAWLTTEKTKSVKIRSQDILQETSQRLYSEEEEEYVEASFVFRTFDQEEYLSDEESDDE